MCGGIVMLMLWMLAISIVAVLLLHIPSPRP